VNSVVFICSTGFLKVVRVTSIGQESNRYRSVLRWVAGVVWYNIVGGSGGFSVDAEG
jgi:hypothetical protein